MLSDTDIRVYGLQAQLIEFPGTRPSLLIPGISYAHLKSSTCVTANNHQGGHPEFWAPCDAVSHTWGAFTSYPFSRELDALPVAPVKL